MMPQQLYQLIPAVHRIRDADRRRALEALLAVLDREAETLEADVEQLYDDWFIETCDEWVVPYIGDLLGVRGAHAIAPGTFSQRALVANTLRYRRRKGTATVLEQLARDATGWPAAAVEFFERLITSQNVNHVRLHNRALVELRDGNSLGLLHGPFETAARSVDVRPFRDNQSRPNLPNVGLFLWRLQSFAVTRADARAVPTAGPGAYTFNPLGLDAPLFNRPRTEPEIFHLAQEINVPGVLRRRALYDELEALRTARARQQPFTPHFFATPPPFEVFLDEAKAPVPHEEVLICDLSDWRRPPPHKTYPGKDGPVELPLRVSVDPALGRLTLPKDADVSSVVVTYAYGFSSDVGGGPYNRDRPGPARFPPPVTWQLGVSRDVAPEPGRIVPTLQEAVDEWNGVPAGTSGAIVILESRSYDLAGLDAIEIPAGSRLLLAAAHWPEFEPPETPGVMTRLVGHWVPDGLRPHLRGDVRVEGTAPSHDPAAGDLVLDGLLLEGSLSVEPGNLGRLNLLDTTIAPGRGELHVESVSPDDANDLLEVRLDRVLTGPVRLGEGVPRLRAQDSLIQATASPAAQPGTGGRAALSRPAPPRPNRMLQPEDSIPVHHEPGEAAPETSFPQALHAPGTQVRLDAVTILGASLMRTLDASNCLFTGPVFAERRQAGCVRFSHVPKDSLTPRRYRCQPDLALHGVVAPAARSRVRARLFPSFTSVHYGDPGYAQLGLATASEIVRGADDQAEMGLFHHLMQPQREANLRNRVDEYLRFGLRSGIIYVT